MKKFILVLWLALSSLLFAACAQSTTQAQEKKPEVLPVWIGIRFEVEKKDDAGGLRVTALSYLSPAGKAGLRLGDIIVSMDGRELLPPEQGADGGEKADPAVVLRRIMEQKSAGDVVVLQVIRQEVVKSALLQGKETDDAALWRSPEHYLLEQPIGTVAELRGIRERNVIDIAVTVQKRPAGIGGDKPMPDAEELARAFPAQAWPEERLTEALLEEFHKAEAYRDLRARLARLNLTADRFRLPLVAHIQNEPFQLRTAGHTTFGRLEQAMTTQSRGEILDLAAKWLDVAAAQAIEPLARDLSLDGHLQQLLALFDAVAARREAAFARLSAEERAFLAENIAGVGAEFAEDIRLQPDRNKGDEENNERVMELASRVDFAELIAGAQLLWRVADRDYLAALETAARQEWAALGKPEGLFVQRDTAYGKVMIGGHGNGWYREDAAIIIDLAGDDYYTNNAGSSRDDTLPIGLLFDFSGNDTYEATLPWTQGAARLGYGVLIDRRGNDQFLSQEWAQGAAALGVALLLDEDGDDVYRLGRYGQGAGLWGIGIHLDLAGNDMYEARLLAQGVGMAGGAGWLIDGGGNDHYYAKGNNPTTYGDAGIFDSWSQGCGLGFRDRQSGGVGLVFDAAGADRYEAGNFSQGGGYYFGIGLLRDNGGGNDVYIGSRYNQGFSAHQALGYFEEMGGQDFYLTRQGVAQGAAWDKSITLFIDHDGDDHYAGGESFSQGASAHNSISIFLDLAGRDRYDLPPGQGRSGPNDYHGGTSLSLFVDGDDRRRDEQSRGIEFNGETGITARLPISLESAVLRDQWRRYLQRP